MADFSQREVLTPHLAIPFRLGGVNGGAIVNEQASSDDVVDQVKLALAFPVGSRIDLPEFGTADLLFRQHTSTASARLSSAILRWVPDAETLVEELDDFDDFVQRYRVNVKSRVE